MDGQMVLIERNRLVEVATWFRVSSFRGEREASSRNLRVYHGPRQLGIGGWGIGRIGWIK